MPYTDGEIKAAIEAWAESKVDAHIAEQITYNIEYNEKYPDNHYDSPVTPEEFDREDIAAELIDEWYSEGTGGELPGLGLLETVQVDRVNDEQWIVFGIDGLYYKISTYYSSYGENYWHEEGVFVRVAPHQKTITEYLSV